MPNNAPFKVCQISDIVEVESGTGAARIRERSQSFSLISLLILSPKLMLSVPPELLHLLSFTFLVQVYTVL